MSQSIARHQAPAKLSSRSLLSVTVFSSRFSSVFSSLSCTFVNISLKWFRLSVSRDLNVMLVLVVVIPKLMLLVMTLMMIYLHVMEKASSRSLVNFARGGRTVTPATRKFLVSCWLCQFKFYAKCQCIFPTKLYLFSHR